MNIEFKLYVITLKDTNRILNINKQQHKINNNIELFDAVNGDLLNEKIIIDTNITIHSPVCNISKSQKRELGCYLSHFSIYKTIIPNNNYSIIFEDDFEILTDKLIDKCNVIIHKLKELHLDFDIIFLGNHSYNHNHGTLVQNNIYKLGNKEGLHGTQGYIVNNNSINKIIEHTQNVTDPIDIKIQVLANDKKLNVFSIFPYYVGEGNLNSFIRG
jgi:GR25 family glycosyltransferase involved in LPS biosynthesis